jgi:DNA-binding transcriptional LysR family regulator
MLNDNVNLNLYKVFHDVCKYGSFSKTAELTYSTQSSISKSIKKLEDELETKLFYRNPHGVELTEDGKELLYYVEKAYGNLLIAERTLLEKENLERGKLNMGLPSYISSFFFFDKVMDFYNKYPNVEINLMNGSRDYLLGLMDKHQIDFIIYSSPINDDIRNKDFSVEKLCSIRYSFFCKTEDYEKYKNIKSVKDLENIPLVLPVPGTNHRKFLDEVLVKNNVQINRTINIHTSEGILTGVKSGLGVGYIISDIVKDNSEYKLIDVKEKLHEEDIVIIYNKKTLTKAPTRFIEENLNIKIK